MTSEWTPRVLVCPAARLDDVFRLRAAVWIGDGADPAAFPDAEWRDERDPRRLHWIVEDDGRLVAAASLGLHDRLADVEDAELFLRAGLSSRGRVAAPARVTVRPQYRGRGVAEALLDAQDAAARAAGATLAVGQASPSMRRLLERRGWQAHGEGPWDVRFPGVEFTVMSLRLQP